MTKTKVIFVAGARPNFMKIAPLIKAAEKHDSEVEYKLVHTGQHYDKKMSDLFFNQLNIPEPDVNLGVGSASHACQTAEIMKKFEEVVLDCAPDYVVVVGDVNSTIACSLVAKKLGIYLAHVEAGLRSFDMEMPEEINRVLTDRISDLLFTTEESANRNLANEGVDKEKIYFVGNVMIDTLLANKEKADQLNICSQMELSRHDYFVLTLHRPSNVDNKQILDVIIGILNEIAEKKSIIFPIHPRTRQRLTNFGLLGTLNKKIILLEPQGYLEFLNLMSNALGVITDSGGIQEETTILGTPCLTWRENTERPVTITDGTNILTGLNKKKILLAIDDIINGRVTKNRVPRLWDGKAAGRIIETILQHHKAKNQ